MKKFILVLIICLSVTSSCFADQLQWMTKEQAEKTVKYIQDNNINQVVLWCACCDKDPKTKINISEVNYRYTGTDDYYEVVITGTDKKGKQFSNAIDLAYAHIKNGKVTQCLGLALGFSCDPCTEPFKWK
jgi:hypothetical protein